METAKWIKKNKPNTIIITSALVGGIHANDKFSADFLYNNSIINLNIINSGLKNNCSKIIFLGASCMYPVASKQPFKETSILDGKVESTNEGYAISKILGLKYLEMINKQHNKKYISVIPAASYGPNDNYDESQNHVIPALIKKFHNAKINTLKSVKLWGSGNAKREFIHVDDMANGIIHILEKYNAKNGPINLGSGEEVTIKKLAEIISNTVGYKGKIIFDKSKPDGVKRKILNSQKIKKLLFGKNIKLKDGIKLTYVDYLDNL